MLNTALSAPLALRSIKTIMEAIIERKMASRVMIL
jgi:hypothetical protein